MDYDSLVQAVIRSFHDVELRVELQPILQSEAKSTRDSGTDPDRRRLEGTEGHAGGSLYTVQHCEVIPTSPLLTTKLLPKPEIPLDDASLHTTRPLDPYASSLPRYPSSEHSEILERLVDYCPSKIDFPSHFTTTTQYRVNDVISRNTCGDTARMPRAPEEHPTRDRRHKGPRNNNTRCNEGRRRETLKSIPSCPSYTTAKEAYTSIDDNDVTAMQRNETLTPEPTDQNSHKSNHSQAVNTTVQATVAKVSREVETVPLPKPCRRSIAIPPPSNPSLPELPATPDEPPHPLTLTTRSVQTLNLPTKSLEIITSSSKCIKYKPVDFTNKKSKSLSDFRLDRDFKKEILEWLDDINDPNIQKIQKLVTKNLTNRLKGMEITDANRFKVKIGNCVKHSISIGSKDSSTNGANESGTHRSSSYRSIANSGHTTDQNNFECVIKEWINNISIKKRDVFQRPVKKDEIHNTFVNRLKHLVTDQPKRQDCPLGDLREEIMEILNEVPIQVKSNEKIDYIYRLTDALIYRLQNISRVSTDPFNLAEKLKVNLSTYRTSEKSRNYVVKETKNDLRERLINTDAVKGLMIDLTNTSINPSNLNITLGDMNKLLLNTTRIPENAHVGEISNEIHADTVQIHPYTVPLTVFMVHEVPNTSNTLGTNMSDDTIGLIEDKDIEANVNQYKMKLVDQINRWLSGLAILESRDNSFKEAAVLDFANDIVDRKKYLEFIDTSRSDADELEHLKYLIFKWLKRTVGEERIDTLDHAAELMEMTKNIPVPIMTRPYHSKPATMNNNKGNNLTNNRRVSINKRRDSKDQNKEKQETESVLNQKNPGKQDEARETLKHDYWGQNPNGSDVQVDFNVKNVNDNNATENYENQSDQVHSKKDLGPSRLLTPAPNSQPETSSAAAKLMAEWRPPPVFTPPPPGGPNLEQIHADFQEFLNNWAQQIPIPDSTPEEAKIAEKARLGILKGIFKTITKIKQQPAVFQNQFYYEDVLGREVDELFDCLPQTQELKEKRYILKAQLLDKTTNMNDLVKEAGTPDNYKDIIAKRKMQVETDHNRSKVKLHDENPTKLLENMLKYCTLDDFLDKKNYKEDDPIKERAYKNKLLKKIQEYMDKLKATHGKEIEDLFSIVKESDIMKVLSNVSLPSEDSIKENKDEILLGLEVDQWMKDLPIVKNDDSAEQRHRIRLKDGLVEKLNEMEKYPNSNDTQKRHEISSFLDKVPLEKNQDLNINEMVHDLTTRLKKKFPSDDKEKSVAFHSGHPAPAQPRRLMTEYEEQYNKHLPNAADNKWPHREDDDARYRAFQKHDPLCSTRIESPGEEWAREEGPDAQYKALFKDRPVSSSMIDPSIDHDAHNAPNLPSFYHPNEMEPYFAYAPGQFNESGRGGFFGQGRGVPQSDSRYRHPDQNGSMIPAQEPQYPRLYDEGSIRRDASMPWNQYDSRGQQEVPLDRSRPGVPPMMQRSADDSGGFVSLQDGSPDMYAPVHQKPQFHQPNMAPFRQSQGGERSMLRPKDSHFVSMISPGGQPLDIPACCQQAVNQSPGGQRQSMLRPNDSDLVSMISPGGTQMPLDIPACCQQAGNQSNLSRDSRVGPSNMPNACRMKHFENPYTQHESLGPIHKNLLPVSSAPNSFRQHGPNVFQPNEAAQDGFASMPRPDSSRAPIMNVPLDSSARSQQGVNQSNMSRSPRPGFSQGPNMFQPNNAAQDEFASMPRPNSPRAPIMDVPLDSSAHSQQGVNQSNMSRSPRPGLSHGPNMFQPNETAQEELASMPRPNSPRAPVMNVPLDSSARSQQGVNQSNMSRSPRPGFSQGPNMFQPNNAAQDELASMPRPTSPRAPIIDVPLDSSARSQQGVNQSNMSRSPRPGFSQGPNMFQPNKATQDEFTSMPRPNSPRAPIIKPNIAHHSCVHKELNKNPIENRSAQESRNRSIRNSSSPRSAPSNNLNSKATSRIPATYHQRDGLAPNVDPSEISNQPVGFSTPNQPITNDVPPNIRERRQMEQERESGRHRDSEEGEDDDRCRCLERFKRWKRDEATDCNVCDSCSSRGGLYSYPYPFLYPYPMQFRPPYPPPHCKK